MAQGAVKIMVIIDSSVWIDQLTGKETRQTNRLSILIENSIPLCTCGIIITEVLQGCREDRLYHKMHGILTDLVYLQFTRDIFIRASDIYRNLRKKGITIRKPIDCMIASICIEHEVELLHGDKDFTQIAKHSKLKTLDR